MADGLKSNPDRHIKCPKCNYRYHYRLGDGRRMCKRCRKRFNYKRARRGLSRGLSEEKRELIAELFWLEVTAARAAKKVGVHPNTVAKYYRIIRERIAADREAELENVELDSIVYSDGWKAYNKLSLNGFHHKRINHEKALANGKVPINGSESS